MRFTLLPRSKKQQVLPKQEYVQHGVTLQKKISLNKLQINVTVHRPQQATNTSSLLSLILKFAAHNNPPFAIFLSQIDPSHTLTCSIYLTL